jgi:hypothetical protein
MRPLPTAPLAAGTLIGGYAVAVASGSRPLGGVVLLLGGAGCMRICSHRHGARTAAQLGAAGFAAFVLSHVLARATGAWPAVLLVSAAVGALTWSLADTRARDSGILSA